MRHIEESYIAHKSTTGLTASAALRALSVAGRSPNATERKSATQEAGNISTAQRQRLPSRAVATAKSNARAPLPVAGLCCGFVCLSIYLLYSNCSPRLNCYSLSLSLSLSFKRHHLLAGRSSSSDRTSSRSIIISFFIPLESKQFIRTKSTRTTASRSNTIKI